ncbi:MAG: lipid-A-disaccharide synthase [Pseudomonadales bacterium]
MVTRLALLAGEASGDVLGASLMRAMKTQIPELEFEGIGGNKMTAGGLQSQVDMERLSVMGLFEPLKRLPELLRIKRNYIDHCIANPPDLFVGIDSPDFNLRVAAELHQHGVRTAHYVSPSVWAWRQKRVFKIKQSVDLMLTLFPFEAAFYEQHDVPVRFVGHPLADELPLQPDKSAFRSELMLKDGTTYVAVLPGSRRGESARMMPVFLESMQWLSERRPDVHYLVPAANAVIRQALDDMLAGHALSEQITVFDGRSQTVMGAADAILLASGTSTLEAMLLKTPMVMAYKVSAATYAIVKHMVKSEFFALPNLLAGESLVPEFIQQDAQADVLGAALLAELEDESRKTSLQARFLDIHHQLRMDASAQAAEALAELMS